MGWNVYKQYKHIISQSKVEVKSVTKQVIEKIGRFTVIHNIPEYTDEELKTIDERILKNLSKLVSKG